MHILKYYVGQVRAVSDKCMIIYTQTDSECVTPNVLKCYLAAAARIAYTSLQNHNDHLMTFLHL